MDPLNIDIKTHATKNHYKTRQPKTQIVLANSLRPHKNHIIRYKYQEFGRGKNWPTFTVMRNGEIYQHFNPKYHSDFLGVKERDIKIISIVLENMGWLKKLDDTSIYYNWLNEVCPTEEVGQKKWKGYNYWHDYPEEQYKALGSLCKMLCENHNILESVVFFSHYHQDIPNYKGIVLLSNHIEHNTNENPFFDLAKLKKELEENSTN